MACSGARSLRSLPPLAGVAANRGYPASQAHFRAASMWFLAKLGFYPFFALQKRGPNADPRPCFAWVQCRVAALRLATRGVAPQQTSPPLSPLARKWAVTLLAPPTNLRLDGGFAPPGVGVRLTTRRWLANVSHPPPQAPPTHAGGQGYRIQKPILHPRKKTV